MSQAVTEIQVPCWTCKQGPGRRCRTAGGKTAGSVHYARAQLRKERAERESELSLLRSRLSEAREEYWGEFEFDRLARELVALGVSHHDVAAWGYPDLAGLVQAEALRR